MAAELKQTLGVEVELVVGGSGEFTVWIAETKVAEKTAGRFPEAEAVVEAVRAARPA